MDQPKILVAIRKRPLSKKQESKGQSDIISVKNRETVIVSEYKQKVDLTKYIEQTPFNFDFAYDENTTNQQIYESAVRPLVDSAFQGARVTCFAYGQTGSGKTYTMNGNQKQGIVGLYALGAYDIFSYLNDPNFQHLKARVSYFEIYCGKLFDLLNKRQQLKIREDNKSNINIIGLEQTHITSWEQYLELLNYGSNQRVTSQNSANAESSRSHAILQITLKEGKKIFGKISFIDLAGNERGADHTDMKKQTRIDGAEINKSLLSLKECIRALDQGKSHTPFRGSKLTMVLKDSFIGFCRTVMIGNVSPSSNSSENTLNTLRYADRVKQLRKPAETVSKQQLKAREMMLPRQNKNAIKISINNDDDAEDIEAKREIAQKNFMPKDQPREMSSDAHYSKKIDEQRGRQKSFGCVKTQLKGSQHLNNKKPIQNQNPPHYAPSPVPKPETKNIYPPSINRPNQTKKNPIYQERQSDPQSQSQMHNFGVGIKSQKSFARNNSMHAQNSSKYQQPKQNNYKGNMDIERDQYDPPKVKPANNYFQNPSPTMNNYKSRYQFQSPQLGLQKANSTCESNEMQPLGLQKAQKFNPMKNNSANWGMSSQPIQQPLQHSMVSNYQSHRIQKGSLPNDWDSMMDFYQRCEDSESRQLVKEKIHETLFNEENQLMNNHSDSLRSTLDVIKSQMSMLGTLENDKSSLTTREYIQFMEESIDQKMSLLEMLREKMAQFSYKLDTIQQFQGQNRGDDEQLLDGLH